ncbi:hypothetical protein JYU34_005574, partial [Plutella xylostella]
MDAESEYEIKRGDAVQMIQTIQSMIDVSAERLKGLRTQCLTSAELTQQEIRTLEGKLVKHFSHQLAIKARIGEELARELGEVPCLAQWLRVVGLSPESIESACSKVSNLEALRERSEHELRALLPRARDEEVRRLCRAMQRLRTYTDAIARGAGGAETAEMQLYWDSWERQRASPRVRTRLSHTEHHEHHRAKGGKSPTEQPAPAPPAAPPAPAVETPISKSRSHESQLSVRPEGNDLSDNSQSSAAAEGSPPASPHEEPPPKPANNINHNNVSKHPPAPRSPRTPTVGPRPGMAHDIAHRFTKTFNMIATCDYCEKQMLFGSGLKCKECKFKCHRDCESKVPPSCGLPPEFVIAFKEKIRLDGGGYYSGSPISVRAASGFPATWTHRPRRRPPDRASNPAPFQGGPDSSSNTSSCNSSCPSSPALRPQDNKPANTFHFPEVKTPVSSPNHNVTQSPARINHDVKEDLVSSVKSDHSRVSLSGSASTDSGNALRGDSLDESANHNDARWPRQNSLSMKEWDIPYDELKLFEVIGTGRFGTVYRGSWHGAVAVKLLHVQALGDDVTPLDTFKHEVATFRKTRHENLVLFMGACMKPPKLAIVTSLCAGMTLYTHVHLRRDKFNANKSVLVAQQLAQGMGYLHARGIIHKDLKSKNIFLENGKVVITDFGLFSVTKLCFGNNARGDSLGIPPGWLGYLAPELARALRPHASVHLPFSKHTDVYAFGTVWYELLVGEWPFKGQPPEAVIWQ